MHELRAALEARFGEVRRLAPIAGGDAHRALLCELASGERIFVKHGGQADRLAEPVRLFASEARGLGWLAELADPALVVPAVRAVLDAPAALCLTWIEVGARTPASEEALGRGLAQLHARDPGTPFGRMDEHYLAGLAFAGALEPSWAARYGQLLTGLAEHAGARGEDEDGAVRRAVERLVPRLGALLHQPRPSLLHGDLWSGNALVDRAGRPVLVDPFAYVGDREVDLAMMGFFGGFSPRTFAAYRAALRPAPGEAERRPLYELVPLLSHTALFGGSYRRSALEVLRRFG